MWQVVVPVKGWDTAKSRLELPPAARRHIVRAMTADTLAALANCSDVNTVSVLIRDRALIGSSVLRGVESVVVQPDPTASLNVALRRYLSTQVGQPTPLAVVVADLPALRAGSLFAVLRDAQQHHFAMVADREGTGTTVLTALLPSDLGPRFGDRSAVAHAKAGAALIASAPDVACDVDTVADLRYARLLGLGPQTASLLSDPAISSWLG
ncbi:MAG: 2-phospho-L-lactate guanylyltransferase [Actinomycetia bacterium]|nr:2-phospho-L-lactate guanylyltransferase [Actinomycetes bacterium]